MITHHRMAATTILSAVALFAATAASAQSLLKPPFNEYGAKFSCGPATADADVVKGTYATSINIHNPQATISVSFQKKFVIALEEGQTPPQPGFIATDNLGPDLAERVDCPLIYSKLKISPKLHIEGFIVIEVPPLAGTAFTPLLDVVGKYTARSGASGFDVVTYGPKAITN